jgi:hypothetical protein
MTSRPSFRPVAAPLEVDDKLLQELNQRLQVPELVKGPRKRAEATPQDAARVEPLPSPAGEGVTPVTESQRAKAAEPEVRLAVNVPVYLRDAVNLRAAKERCTSRHIVMQGLLALGFEIDPADMMVDGRQPASRR